MKITILGTGTFYITNKRSGPAYLLEAGGKKILIDCGPGTLSQLTKIGVKPEELDYIFISHLHADHTSDLFPLQMNIRLFEFFAPEKVGKAPEIYGPKGIVDFTKKLSQIYELPAFDNFDKIKYHEVENEVDLAGTKVTAYPVEHVAFGFPAHAIAYKFESEGKTFVFSGDSSNNEGLKKSCEGADLFICDCSYTKGHGGTAHLDTTAIGEISEAGKVKILVLTHFYPNTEEIDLVAEVKEKFSGECRRGEDLMEIDV